MAMGKGKALRNLSREIRNIERRTLQGMYAAGLLVKGHSQNMTPVDKGNLKASHYVVTGKTRSGLVVEIGCTADYSIYVHEDLDAHHNVGEAKFLENAIKNNKKRIVDTIRRLAKIK